MFMMVYAKKVTEAFLKHAEHAIFIVFIVYVSPEVFSYYFFKTLVKKPVTAQDTACNPGQAIRDSLKIKLGPPLNFMNFNKRKWQ